MSVADSERSEESDFRLKAKRARKQSRRRRKNRHAREEYARYTMRPTTWDYYFSFDISDPKGRWDPGRYSQLVTLSFKGNLIQPIDPRYKHADVTLSARIGMMEERPGEVYRSIGSLTANGDALSAYVFVPAEFMSELVVVAQSGRVQAIHFSGTRLRYRSASLRGVSLTTRNEEEDEEKPEETGAVNA
jgi:hypothetical protein